MRRSQYHGLEARFIGSWSPASSIKFYFNHLYYQKTMASATEGPGVPGDKIKMQDERRSNESSMRDVEKKPQMLSGGAKQIFRPRIIAMACIVSMGGFSMQSSHHINTLANQVHSLRI